MNTTSPGITLRNEGEGTGNTTFKYDIQGRLIQKTQTHRHGGEDRQLRLRHRGTDEFDDLSQW